VPVKRAVLVSLAIGAGAYLGSTESIAQDSVTAPPAVRAREDDDVVAGDAIPLVPPGPDARAAPTTGGWMDWRGERYQSSRHARWLFFAADLGPAYRQFSGLSMVGASLFIGADLELRRLALRVGSTLEWGRLLPALSLVHGSVGGTLEGVFGIFRFGGGVGFGALTLSSVTADPSPIAPTLEIELRTSVDVAKLSDRGAALFVGARLNGSFVVANMATPFLWGPSVTLGTRL
jgi:hypothetical protein